MFKIGQGSLKLHKYLQSRTNVKQSFKFGLRMQRLIELVDLVEAVHCHGQGWGAADHAAWVQSGSGKSS